MPTQSEKHSENNMPSHINGSKPHLKLAFPTF